MGLPEEVVAHVAADLGMSTARTRRLAHTALPAGLVRPPPPGGRVLLVEGPTDRVVLSVLLSGLDAAGPGRTAVLDVGGKHLLPLAAAVVRRCGGSPHVLLDGDADGWRRAAKPARVRATHRRSTETVVAALTRLNGSRGATGEPGVLAPVPVPCTVLPDDLEAELARWPSFVAALGRAGGELRVKDPLRYAAAARGADPDDAPAVLRGLAHW